MYYLSLNVYMYPHIVYSTPYFKHIAVWYKSLLFFVNKSYTTLKNNILVIPKDFSLYSYDFYLFNKTVLLKFKNKIKKNTILLTGYEK